MAKTTMRSGAHSTKSNEIVAGLMAAADTSSSTIRVLSKVLSETMEEIHGRPYRVDVSHELNAPFIFIRPND